MQFQYFFKHINSSLWVFWPRLGLGFFYASFTFSNFYLDFYFPFFIGLLFSLFSWDFYPPFLFGFLFPFFLRTFIFCLDVYSIAVTFWISSKFFTCFWFDTVLCLWKYPRLRAEHHSFSFLPLELIPKPLQDYILLPFSLLLCLR